MQILSDRSPVETMNLNRDYAIDAPSYAELTDALAEAMIRLESHPDKTKECRWFPRLSALLNAAQLRQEITPTPPPPSQEELMRAEWAMNAKSIRFGVHMDERLPDPWGDDESDDMASISEVKAK